MLDIDAHIPFHPTQPAESSSREDPVGLSLSKHPWPLCFSAAVSKLLDDARIPNFVWGDLLNRARGNPQLANVCGFIVPTAYLHKAAAQILHAGLLECPCKSSRHNADPASKTSLPIHFNMGQRFNNTFLFLCPDDTLLNLIPLMPTHPNPASLRFDRLRVSLHDHSCNPSIDTTLSPKFVDDTYTLNILITPSLIKALLLLHVFSPHDRTGIVYTYPYLLATMAIYGTPPGPYDLESPSLQRLWDTMFCDGDMTTKTREVLRKQVEIEWAGLLFPEGQSR